MIKTQYIGLQGYERDHTPKSQVKQPGPGYKANRCDRINREK
jgi:hypothetical protein